MRPALLVCALFLAAFFFAPAADAQDDKPKKAKKVKSQGTYQIYWGRRKDITLRFWPLHQHPYVKIQ